MTTISNATPSHIPHGSAGPVLYDCGPAGDLALEFARRSKPITLGADRVLFREGDPPNGVFFLRSGSAMMTIKAAGRVVLRARAETGSLLGLPSTFREEPYSMTATASPDAEIDYLSPESFRGLIGSHPELSFNVVQILASEVRSVRKALTELVSSS